MKVEIDKESGFCFGVLSAIGKAEEELKQDEALYCLGDIVHNGIECQRLSDMGLRTINHEQFNSLSSAKVLLRAHGEPPSTYLTAKKNNIKLVDATCPVVLKLQQRIHNQYVNLDLSKQQIVIFGQKGHAEVIGLEGQTNNTAIVVESVKDLDTLNYDKSIFLFSQTTKSVEGFREVVSAIEAKRAGNMTPNGDAVFEYHDTICRNVANRVKRLQDFARSNNIVIFVGGKKSSNAKVLYNHCLEVNASTVFVSSVDDLTNEITRDCHSVESVGICGATSTPKWLMEQIKSKIESI